jgi:hypothetical protein
LDPLQELFENIDVYDPSNHMEILVDGFEKMRRINSASS